MSPPDHALQRSVRKVDRAALRADVFKLLCLTLLFALAVLLTACAGPGH